MRSSIVRTGFLLSLVGCTVFGGCGSTNRAAPIVDRTPAPVTTSIETRTVEKRKRAPETRQTVAKIPAKTSAVAPSQASSETRNEAPQTAGEIVARAQQDPKPQQEEPITTKPPLTVKPYREGDWRPEYYTVQKGDTLYSIALEFGQPYQDLSNWNSLTDPTYIQIGQQLRLFPKQGQAEATTLEPVALAPASLPGSNEEVKVTSEVPEFSDPKAYRADYSTQALADIRRSLSGESIATKAPPKTAAVTAQKAESEAPATIKSVQAGRAALPDERLNWEWPAPGKVLYKFTEGPNKKGLVIQGDPGQAIVSSAPGKVVYSGSGLRGYGNLLIIKHNATYLSVYAHNSQLLVREGQLVAQGQKIAVMGNSGGGPTALHFEIRRLGKPIDPLEHLPGRPS